MGNEQAEATQRKCGGGSNTGCISAIAGDGHWCHRCHWCGHPGANLHSTMNPRVVTKESKINNQNNFNVEVSELLLDATILVLLHTLKSHQSCVLSLHAPPAVNLNIGPCNESCLITCEIAAGVRNIRRCGRSAKRDGSYKCLAILRRVGFAQEQVRPDTTMLANESWRRRPVAGDTHMPVLPTTGETALKRICLGPYSTARVFVALTTAALDALYQVSLGRGRIAAVDAT